MYPDLSRLSVKELLRLESGIVAELRCRKLVRTNNKPLGDIAEQIVRLARGGELESNSAKSYDLTDASGSTIQVKAMGARAAGRSGKFSPFRTFDFGTAVFLVFEAGTFDLLTARELEAHDVKLVSKYSRHTNGWQPTLRQIESAGRDVLDEMRAAYLEIDRVCGPMQSPLGDSLE